MNIQLVHVTKTGPSKPPPGQLLRQLARGSFDIGKFAENFDVLVAAAGSSKHLKDLVLQLAVSGQLSGATDETADSLFAELQRQRRRLGKAGVRIGEPSPPVANNEAPYAIPSGWRWIRLRDLGGFLGGGTPSKSNASFWQGPLPWVSPKDMKRPHIDDAEDHISAAAVEGSAVKLIPAQSILYVVRGMILAHSFPVAIAMREVTINQDMKALVLAMPALSEFVLRSCQAAKARILAKVERSSHGTCRLESGVVEVLPIALPPLAEQKRIVARVDQLMALIDDLEAKQTKKRDLSTRFTKASLEALTAAESPKAFNTAWQRVVENFPTVVDSAEKVPELRRAVECLLLQGKLHLPIIDARVDVDQLRAVHEADWRAEFGEANYREPGSFEPLPSLPSGWCSATVELIFPVVIDSAHRTPTYSPTGSFPALRPRDVVGGVLRLDQAVRVLPPEYEKQTLRRVPKGGDIVYSRELSYGWGAVLPHEPAVCLSQGMVSLRPSRLLLVEYAVVLLNSLLGRSQARAAAIGAAHPHVNLKDIKAFRFPIPPIEVQSVLLERRHLLMKLCDELGAKLCRAEDRASKLVESVVKEMVA